MAFYSSTDPVTEAVQEPATPVTTKVGRVTGTLSLRFESKQSIKLSDLDVDETVKLLINSTAVPTRSALIVLSIALRKYFTHLKQFGRLHVYHDGRPYAWSVIAPPFDIEDVYDFGPLYITSGDYEATISYGSGVWIHGPVSLKLEPTRGSSASTLFKDHKSFIKALCGVKKTNEIGLSSPRLK